VEPARFVCVCDIVRENAIAASDRSPSVVIGTQIVSDVIKDVLQR
jgi:hypothetical protein